MLSFKPASADQYDGLFRLMQADAGDYLQQSLTLTHMTWEEFARLFRTVGSVFGIYQEDCLAGFYWMEERGKILHLHCLVLKAEFRGKGIGTAVLQMLAGDFQGRMDAIELGVHQSNEGAIRLYRRHGFEVVTELEDLGYYVMQKSLAATPA